MTTDATDPTSADTIVLIHGLWMTPRSWEHWAARYESQGYTVLAPAWPGMGERCRGAQRGIRRRSRICTSSRLFITTR